MFSVYLGEPQRPLVPGNTTETEGGKVIGAVWTLLVTFDEDTRTVTYDGAAESVTSTDNIRWTIKLGRLDLSRRHARHRPVLRAGLELHGAEHQRPGRVVLLRQRARL